MNRLTLICIAILVTACDMGPRRGVVKESIDAEMKQATENRKAATPEAVQQALLPPLATGAPTKPREQRFDLNVANAPAGQVFMAIVSGTRYSMVVHPEVTGAVSVNLKDVTVGEALEALRELYGYEYKVQGNRIFIHPISMQSRVFQVNYLTSLRQGRSNTRVASGSIVGTTTQPAAATPGQPQPVTPGTTSTPTLDGSLVSTSSRSDFWGDLEAAIKAIIGGGQGGRSVVISPQAGLLVVRAMPRELREVEDFLRASRITVERQVMLEAKILEVRLSEGAQAGINWAAFNKHGDHGFSVGADPTRFNVPGSTLPGVRAGSIATTTDSTTGVVTASTLGQVLARPFGGGILGLAFQTGSFAALLSFLETQGSVQVLSSPRIATLNNQKAVLKVGTDEFFVTNVTTTSSTSGTTTTTSPTITVQPFFSGIALDVTPQIDEDGNIILHVRPSVSTITEKTKNIDLGTLGTFTLPLASSAINESDTIVRVGDGNVVAIGGLMQQTQTDGSSKVPGIGEIASGLGGIFKHGEKSLTKRELVVLIKPTVIHSDKQWQEDVDRTRQRFQGMVPPEPARPPAQ
jgi:MSHA biogenesis protein MshL